MSVLVYDCGSVENTVTAILDTESGAMIIRGNGDIDNYADESSPWYSEHSDILQVTVDKGITRIGSGTFYGCENLSFVEIASTVTSIGADVFQNCTSLTSIKIPKSITAIGNGTFTDSGLTEVKFYGNPPTVGTDIFDGVTADVYTPEGNEEWNETAKGTVAGNGSNLTWKEFDSKPNLIEYDELDYLWSKIKKYVDNNVSVTQVVSSGTKIATITINGVDTDLYSSPFSGTVGSSTTPIYIDNGTPTACGGSLDVDITGNAATATTANNINVTNTGATTYNIVTTSGVVPNTSYSPKVDTSGAFTFIGSYDRTSVSDDSHTVQLVLGNAISDNDEHDYAKARDGALRLYSNKTRYTILKADSSGGSNIVTLPSAGGTLALTSSDITGNAATATTAESCSGNAETATTATNANNLKVTHTGAAWRDILSCATGFTSASNQAVYGHNSGSMAYYVDANATSGNQRAILRLGNATVNTTAAGHNGLIWMYGTNTGYTEIKPGHNSTGSITVTLPSTTGTIALEKAGSVPVYYVEGPSTDTTAGTWTGSITGLTAYYDGLTVLYVPAVAGASATTLNINSIGAKTCYYTNTSALTTHFSVGTPILLTYRDNAWRRADYNSNTTYSAMSVAEGTAGTATNSRTMRADYLKQIIAALPSASCTGSSASCTGNAASSTYATNIRVTSTKNNNYYYAVGTSGNTASTNYAPAVFPNIVIRDDTDSTSEVFSRLRLGNATAKGTSGGKTGCLTLYGNNTKLCNLLGPEGASADFNVRLPTSAGTLALTSSDITGSSASCTGNAATATTATNANKLKTTVVADAKWYSLLGVLYNDASAANSSVCRCSVKMDLGWYNQANSANTSDSLLAYTVLRVGNNIANAANGEGRRGIIRIQSNTAKRVDIVAPNSLSADRTVTLPSSDGTLALTSSNITGSASKWGGYALSVVTSLPASPNASTIYLVK